MIEDIIYSTLANLFSLGGLLAFLGGVVVARIYYWCEDRITDMVEPEKAPHNTTWHHTYLVWALIIIMLTYLGIKQQTVAMNTQHLQQDMVECQHEFNTALKARSELSDEADALSDQERDSLTHWLLTLVNPPPELRDVKVSDPSYQAWADAVTNDYLAQLKSVSDQRKAALDKRKEHPLPEPTCGK